MSSDWDGGPIHIDPDETKQGEEHPPEEWVAEMPSDAQRLGLDRTTPEGQLVGFFAGLQGGGRRAKVVAWCLIVLFVGPILASIVLDLF
jgi:hypothetical protein